ncbi:MAG: hypothetical protein ACRDRK_05765 [Pseudonocardia sp.]
MTADPVAPLSAFAVLDMDIRTPERSERGERIDCYALPETDLSRYPLVVVSGTIDQEFLARHREVIRRYLDGGGVLLFGGQLHRDWLPGASRFVPLARPSLEAYRVAEIAPHPIFDGVEPDDLTFRRGVAGFFARGHHPPPPGAEVLVRLSGGEPATYIDRVTTAGTIVVHANGDLLGYDGLPGSTATRLSGQFLAWAFAESATRRAAPPHPHPHPASCTSQHGELRIPARRPRSPIGRQPRSGTNRATSGRLGAASGRPEAARGRREAAWRRCTGDRPPITGRSPLRSTPSTSPGACDTCPSSPTPT